MASQEEDGSPAKDYKESHMGFQGGRGIDGGGFPGGGRFPVVRGS
jgi:hypothetical protein